jgi:hypothetical protein
LRSVCWTNEDVSRGSKRPKEPLEISEESMELLTCTRCKNEKPANADFFPLHNKKANGLDSWCRECRSSYRSEIRRGRYRQFGCDDATIKELLSVGECVICGTASDSLVIDHCHKTKTVRGVLCGECNLGLGKFKDDPFLLEFARIYLLSFAEDPEGEKYLSSHSADGEAA